MSNYIILRSKWLNRRRDIRQIQESSMWYFIRVTMHQIHFEQVFTLEIRKGGQLVVFQCSYVTTILGAVQRSSAIYAQNAINWPVAACLLRCQHRQQRGNKGNQSHSADDDNVWCHSIKCMFILMEFKDYANFRKSWLRQWKVKINLTIFWGLASALFNDDV